MSGGILTSPLISSERDVTMGAALRFEWIRVRTLRSTWVLIAAALGVQFLCALLYGTHHDMTVIERFTSSFGLATQLGAVFVAAIGVAAFGTEYQHRTITVTLLAMPSRIRVLAAKCLVIAGLGALTGVSMVAAVELGLMAGGAHPIWNSLTTTAGVGAVLYVLLAGVVGLALAGLTRHSMATLGAVIVWSIVLEDVLVGLLKLNPHFLPFSGMAELFDAPVTTPWFAALPLIGLAAVLLAANAITLTRRDA